MLAPGAAGVVTSENVSEPSNETVPPVNEESPLEAIPPAVINSPFVMLTRPLEATLNRGDMAIQSKSLV